jgi:hypothetical protein
MRMMRIGILDTGKEFSLFSGPEPYVAVPRFLCQMYFLMMFSQSQNRTECCSSGAVPEGCVLPAEPEPHTSSAAPQHLFVFHMRRARASYR